LRAALTALSLVELADAVLTDRWALPTVGLAVLAVLTGLGLTPIDATGLEALVAGPVVQRLAAVLRTAQAALV